MSIVSEALFGFHEVTASCQDAIFRAWHDTWFFPQFLYLW